VPVRLMGRALLPTGALRAMSANGARRLIWVPIVHAKADLGNMSGLVRDVYIRRMGKAKYEHHVKTIDEMWKKTRQQIERLNLSYDVVRLYQDGLPNCGREVEIVRDLAQAGSPNHRLLADLMEKGARITGTESPELLLEEYELARQALLAAHSRQAAALAPRQKELGQRLLDRRDSYIARRIDGTLAAGETGMIFLGLLHSLAGRLPPSIQVILLRDACRLLGDKDGAGPAPQGA